MSKIMPLLIAVLLLFSACAGSGNVQSGNRSASRTIPGWVDNPDTVYPSQYYLAVTGYGGDRNQAEHDALAKLIRIFGQTVEAEIRTLGSFSQAVRDGVIEYSEDRSIQSAVTTSAEMDNLIGAEIDQIWYDDYDRLYYAAAVMDREKTSILYANLIHSNERIIAELVNMTNQMKYSLEGYSRYLLAGTIADANYVYGNVLMVIGNTRGINTAALKRGDEYRLVAAEIVRNIPIGISINGDRNDRIKNAFSKVISDAGFRSGANNSRYMLHVNVTLSPVDLPNNQNIFSRIEVSANLVDTDFGINLLPFSFNNREGHLSQSEADNRAITTAERRINDEFADLLNTYLSRLSPSR